MTDFRNMKVKFMNHVRNGKLQQVQCEINLYSNFMSLIFSIPIGRKVHFLLKDVLYFIPIRMTTIKN